MKRIFFGIIMLIVAASVGCKEKSGEDFDVNCNPYDFYYSFAPREVNYVWVFPRENFFAHVHGFELRISTNNRLLDCETYPDCDIDTWMQLDTSLPQVEEFYRKDHPHCLSVSEMIKYLEDYPKKPGILVEGRMSPTLVEYRTEGIAELKVTADKSLWGGDCRVRL